MHDAYPSQGRSCAYLKRSWCLGVVPGQIGLIQATEAIKLILVRWKPLIGRFLIYDALDADFKVFTLKKNEKCPLCGENQVITGLEALNYRGQVLACAA